MIDEPRPTSAKKKTRDIAPPRGDCLNWDCDDETESLKRLHAHVEGIANAANDWYGRNTRWKRVGSRVIQALALTFAAAGGIVPIIMSIVKPWFTDGKPIDSGLVASLLVGVAAALLGMDKAFGFSSAWVRYTLASTSIRKALVEFQVDWAALSAAPCEDATSKRTLSLIQRSKEFVTTVEALVLEETKEWVAEFQSNMAQTEKDVKAQLDNLNAKLERTQQAKDAASKTGSIELTVPNADKADPFRFEVTLEPPSGQATTDTVTNNKVWTKTPVPPGHCKITLSATAAGGKAVGGQGLVDVKPGEIAKASISLQI